MSFSSIKTVTLKRPDDPNALSPTPNSGMVPGNTPEVTMPDQKDVAQDKKALEQKRDAGEDPAENTVHEPQPGKKPKLERDDEGNVKE